MRQTTWHEKTSKSGVARCPNRKKTEKLPDSLSEFLLVKRNPDENPSWMGTHIFSPIFFWDYFFHIF